MDLLPRVKSIKENGCEFRFGKTVTVYSAVKEKTSLEIVKKKFRETAGVVLNLKFSKPNPKATGIIIAQTNPKLSVKQQTVSPPTAPSLKARFHQKATPPPHSWEGYRIEIGKNITVTGAGSAGLFYGMQTLLQIFRQSKSILKGAVIDDYPDYPVRMVMYDIARSNHIRMEHLKAVADRFSEFKINSFMLYLENHFVFKKHPSASAFGSLSPEDAKELDNYCRERFIELIPQYNAYGHNDDMLSTNWRNRHLADDPNSPYQLCATNPEALQWAKDIITEMSAPFKTKFFHAGGDETSPAGNCERCAPLLKKIGPDGIYAMHFNRIYNHVKKIKKRMMIWGDIVLHYPKIADKLPKDIVIFDWHYEGSSPDTVKFFKQKGYDVYVCPSDWSWYAMFPAFSIPAENVLRFLPDGLKNGASGECMTVWEMYQNNHFHNNWFSIILSAEAGWNAGRINYNTELVREYEKAFAINFFGTKDTGYTDVLRLLEFSAEKIFPPFKTTPPEARRLPIQNDNPFLIKYIFGQDFTETHYAKLNALFDGALKIVLRFRKRIRFNNAEASLMNYPALLGKLLIDRIRRLNENSKIYRTMYKKQDSVRVAEMEKNLKKCVDNLKSLADTSEEMRKRHEYAYNVFGAPAEDMWAMKNHANYFRTYAVYMEYHAKNFKKGIKLFPPFSMKI